MNVQRTTLDAGHRESALIARDEDGDKTAHAIRSMLRRIVVHQFHNTSFTARMRNKWDTDDGRYLKEDAGNLAPFLYRLQKDYLQHYNRIVHTIRLILPFFADFELIPEFGKLLLRWRERGSDHVFNASQADERDASSNGPCCSLRATEQRSAGCLDSRRAGTRFAPVRSALLGSNQFWSRIS